MARLSISRGPFASLRWRLLAAFVAVSFGAVALVAGIAAASVQDNTARLLDRQRDQLREQIASALSAAFAAGQGSAETSTLAGLQALAAAQGAQLDVIDSAGRHLTEQQHGGATTPATPSPTATTPLPTTPTAHPTDRPSTDQRGTAQQSQSPTSDRRYGTAEPTATQNEHGGVPSTSNRGGHGSAAVLPTVTPAPAVLLVAATPTAPGNPPAVATNDRVTIPITVEGSQVATAYLNLPTSDAAVAAAKHGLLGAVMWAAALAAALATAVAIVVSRRVSKPLLRLASATRAFAAGDPHPETRLRPAPGELGEVGRTFAAMAATLHRQEELRRSLIADVAHELRTPVTILRGQTEQFLDGIEEPSTARIVSLHDEVLRLERLTDDLATLSAADAAGLSLRRLPTNLSSLTRQTIDSMLPTLAAAELDIETDIEDDVVLDADADRIAQVITNLLVNAAKFTPARGRIEAGLHRDATHAILIVSDSGPGILDDELPHVFERFWRGRAKGHTSGSGVGLAVVQSIVDAHDGTVVAENNAAGGARFIVRLPAHTASANRPEVRHPQVVTS